MLIKQLLILTAALATTISVAASTPCPPQTLEDKSSNSYQRQAFFGDTHIHTSFSQDANWRMGTHHTTPDDAYRFAKGETIALPPFDKQGQSTRALRIDRPLDFAVVTDHAEEMAIVRTCNDPNYSGYQHWSCKVPRSMGVIARVVSSWVPGVSYLCQNDDTACQQARQDVWQDTIDAAQQHNTPCEFTSFIGYEWSGLNQGSNLHRNVIFKNDRVIERPISAVQAPLVEQLWQALDQQCNTDQHDCDVVTIPHNANLSQGKMFSALLSNGDPLNQVVALQRQRYEKLAEIIQHKGSSECFYPHDPSTRLFDNDEQCQFENLPYSSFLGKYFAPLKQTPKNDSRYLREALREGLRIEKTLGINPMMFGFIGSTDTHISAAGAVIEHNYQGNHGAQNLQTLTTANSDTAVVMPDRAEQNPGGLAVLYAEHNTRDALFAAIQRREAYATSGPRIQLRFFAGYGYPNNWCQADDALEQAYQGGVPMGGELTNRQLSPQFLVSAYQDNGAIATPLQRIQIVKVWTDNDGQSHERIFEVAGNQQAELDFDGNQCQAPRKHQGFSQLCQSWQDPTFDPRQSASYYARVLELPSCRWQQYICEQQQVNCANPSTVDEALAACCDNAVSKTIQERAWSSPIWLHAKPDRNRFANEATD